ANSMSPMTTRIAASVSLFYLLSPGQVFAAGVSPSQFGLGKTDSYSSPLQIVILLTVLTLLPAIVMSITPFLRISIVLHFLRQALGTQSAPSNQTLVGLALFLTLVLIQPLSTQIYTEAWQPMEAGKITGSKAWDVGTKPLKMYLGRFVREK